MEFVQGFFKAFLEASSVGSLLAVPVCRMTTQQALVELGTILGSGGHWFGVDLDRTAGSRYDCRFSLAFLIQPIKHPGDHQIAVLLVPQPGQPQQTQQPSQGHAIEAIRRGR